MRALTLVYHDVIAGSDFDASGRAGPVSATFKMEVTAFRRHLSAIAEARARPVTVPKLIGGRMGGLPLLLTFDDGGSSAYWPVADLLERAGWRGHFFVITDRIGTSGFLTADQLRDLHGRGHIIGSHSCSHPTRMSSCGWGQLTEEWDRSAQRLSRILGTPVTTASVPGGHYSTNVAKAAARVGITTLFTSEPTIRCTAVDGCQVLGRFSVRRDTPARLPADLAAGKRLPRVRQRLFWEVKKVAKSIGGTFYLTLRDHLLK